MLITPKKAARVPPLVPKTYDGFIIFIMLEELSLWLKIGRMIPFSRTVVFKIVVSKLVFTF